MSDKKTGIEISNITKHFDSFKALDDLSLNIKGGKLTALLGPSGSGKTTLLRIIAGLESNDSGSIKFFGEDVTKKAIKDRGIGFVFQHYALFKHMNIHDNIAFGLQVRDKKTRPSKKEISDKVASLLDMIKLPHIANRYPSELSGGQRQRVALARALALEPKVLLLDEPFGALDAKVRQDLRRWLRKLHDEIHLTSIFVTHDQEEALEVSDEIVILNHGKIEQIGTPEEVYDTPANPFVYNFLGNVNQLNATIGNGSISIGDELTHSIEDGLNATQEAHFFVRPHEISLELENLDGKGIEAKVLNARALGARVRVELETILEKILLEADIYRIKWGKIKNANQNLFIHFLCFFH